MLNKIFKHINYRKDKILQYYKSRKTRIYYREKTRILSQCNSDHSRIFLFLTPEYGNLGDHLLALCERSFFERHFPDNPLIEITMQHYRYDCDNILKIVKPEDLIVITGGGFIGDTWPINNALVLSVIKKFDKNKRLILPQTIFFEHEDPINSEFIQIVNADANITVFTREMNSYKLLMNYIKTEQIGLSPDMALSYQEKLSTNKRSGIFLCLRDDKEGIVNKKKIETIVENFAKKINVPVKHISTELDGHVLRVENRDAVLTEFISKCSKAELIITDRLHGMIFSVISGTPCLAFDNTTHKISGVYNWIGKETGVQLIENEHDLENVLFEFKKNDVVSIHSINEEYKNLIHKVVELLK